MMPFRRVIGPSDHENRLSGPSVEFFSPRLQRRVVAWNPLRFDHYVTIEMDPEVESYEPKYVKQIGEGPSSRKIEFDSLVVYRDGRKIAYRIRLSAVTSANDGEAENSSKDMDEKFDDFVGKYISIRWIRGNDILLANCHKMFRWLCPPHDSGIEANRSCVLGTLCAAGSPVSLRELAELSKLDIDLVVPVVVEGYVKQRIGIDISARPFGHSMVVQPRQTLQIG